MAEMRARFAAEKEAAAVAREREANALMAVEEAAAAKEALYTVAEAREEVAARAAAAAAEAAAVKEVNAAAARKREASDAMNFAVVQATVHRVVRAAGLKAVEMAGATSPRPCSRPRRTPARAAPHWSLPATSTRGGSAKSGSTPMRPPSVHLAHSAR